MCGEEQREAGGTAKDGAAEEKGELRSWQTHLLRAEPLLAEGSAAVRSCVLESNKKDLNLRSNLCTEAWQMQDVTVTVQGLICSLGGITFQDIQRGSRRGVDREEPIIAGKPKGAHPTAK